MVKRNFILSTIKKTFQKFGYLPLETPSMENLSVLMGKYGDEGDQLLFKILNSGDYLKNVEDQDLKFGSKATLRKVSEKGLRYDLTVPFARYVAMNRHELALPFKRYQIQPVWRADRPQKGRYREFFQCDADVVGTTSLICEAEIILMISEIFTNLGIEGYKIRINHRKILAALASISGGSGQENDFCIAIDKLDKIGKEKVIEEMISKGFSAEKISAVFPILESKEKNIDLIATITEAILGSAEGELGLSDLSETLDILGKFNKKIDNLIIDPSLARGLSYYTGIIFEVSLDDGSMGSLSGGGRYDNLTGVFGVDDIPGTGFSLGVDRIYDVMETRGLFPKQTSETSQILFSFFDKESQEYCLPLLSKLRDEGINSEIYPDVTKIKKLMSYANKKHIPYVIIVGSEEINTNILTLKNMSTGSQDKLTIDDIIIRVKAKEK
jgi:histidyl-tRNA synthetase